MEEPKNLNENYDKLYISIVGEGIGENSRKVLQEAIQSLNDRERRIIERRFGLITGLPDTLESISREVGVGKERIRQIEIKGLRNLKKIINRANLIAEGNTEKILNAPIELLNVSKRTYNCLFKAKLNTIGDILQLPKEELARIRNLRPSYLEEIKKDLKEMGLTLKEYEKPADILDTSIRNLNLSKRAYNCLYRKGIATLGDISQLTMEELAGIRNLGQITLEEVANKLAEFGLTLGDN